jgi:glycine/D-amino acid oxidase-like deaminating enzyme
MLGMTFDHMPHLGTVDGVHFATGCNGSGIAMMSHLGWRAARRILGAPDGASAFDGLPFPAPPVRAARPWLVPLAAGWYRLRDGLDRLA